MKKVCVLLFYCLLVNSLFAQSEISGLINDYTKVVQIEADSCQTLLMVDDASAFALGDQVVLIQMQGAQINASNNSGFGTVEDIGNAGLYEIHTISNITGNQIEMRYQLMNAYDIDGGVQLVRMPVYDDAEIINTLTAGPWNGDTGGVLALQVNGQLLMNGQIDVSGLGFRGGLAASAANNNCTWIVQQDDYFYGSGNWRGSAKGEGIATIIADKEYGKGAQANGGGGGNDHNSGGGGGANISAGGAGGENNEPSTFGCKGFHPGLGGRAIEQNSNRLFLGGGGGAGHGNNDVATNGGAGGGIVILIVNEFFPLGWSIIANGRSPENGGGDGAGGGGAGGTILLRAEHIETVVHLTAQGGAGGLVNNGNAERCHGPGGGGSGGRILTNLMAGDPFATLLNGGNAGISINSSSCSDGTNGAEAGSTGLLESLGALPVANDTFPIPIADFIFLVNGNMVDFNQTAENANSYNWSFGDTETSMLENPSHEYPGNGSYTVELIVANACGQDTIIKEVVINVQAAPAAGFSMDVEEGCTPLTVNFNNFSTGAIDNYQWIFEGGVPTSSTQSDPVIVYNSPGVYPVRLIVEGPGGADTLMMSNAVSVLADPVADFSYTINGGTVEFINLSTDADISGWDFGDGNSDTQNSPDHSYTESGSYTVQLIVSNDCGMDTIVQTVEIDLETVLSAFFSFGDGSGCAPWIVNFENLSTGNVSSYEWLFEGGIPASSVEMNPQVIYNTPGTYDVQLTVTGSQGIDVFEMEDAILIESPVLADFTFSIDENTVTFENLSLNATDYEWDFGDGSIFSNEENPIHEYPGPGTYTVTLAASSLHCGAISSEVFLLDFLNISDVHDLDFIKIFPNPAKEVLHIQVEMTEWMQVKIFSMDGREIAGKRQTVQNHCRLDISDLQNGLYILLLEIEGAIYQFKLSKI